MPCAASTIPPAQRSRAFPCAWASRPTVVRSFLQVTSAIRFSRGGGPPGTPGACITPSAAVTRRRLSLSGGFAVLDGDQRRFHSHAHAQGHSDLASYLGARCQQQASPAQLASELDTTPRSSGTCWTPQASLRHRAK